MIHQLPSAPSTSKLSGMTIDNPILIVEDNKLSGSLLKANIHKYWNVDIHEAGSFAEAKALLKLHRFEYLVAICDLNLPDAPNGEILDLIDKAEVRFIALTGAFDRQTRKTLAKKHFVDYILKDSRNSYDYVSKLVGRLYKNQFKRVLIAEDSLSASVLLQEILSLLNFQVLSAENGAQALEILAKNKDIRLVITDYEMPVMDGFEFTAKARDLLDKNQLAIIGLSASDRTDLGAMFLKKGANDFLLKPYSFEELLCRINMNMDTLDHLDYIDQVVNTDKLTGLYNRLHFQSCLNTELSNVVFSGTNLILALVDIDDFKNLNKQIGSDGADSILQVLASLLQEHFSHTLIARVATSTFAVLLKDLNNEEAIEQLKALCSAAEQSPVTWNEHTLKYTVSVGASANNENSLDDMQGSAENNVFKAQRLGGNQVVFK